MAGNSDLYAVNGARLFGGSTFNFFAGSGLTGTFFYLDNVTLDFEDGAILTTQTIEHATAVPIPLPCPTGFTTLTPGGSAFVQFLGLVAGDLRY